MKGDQKNVDRTNFRKAYARIRRSVFRMCFLYLKDYHLAEDATQGTFMKAMKKLKDYFELHIK